MNTPLVSICCVTYNHAPFIRKCLDGFLMQQTNFPLEILIHDDCSTDGTTEIIKEYAAKYPDLISPLYEEVNQYQQGKASEIDFYNYRRARGKYIAYCEGDDYWTDPLKLQKQVDFMEDNPEYSVCFHDFDELDIRTGRLRKDICAHKNVFSRGDDVEVTVDKFLRNAYLGQPLTMVFRLSAFDLSWRDNYEYYRDTHEIYHLLRAGKGKILGFVGGVYIIHNGGVSSPMLLSQRTKIASEIFLELYQKNITDIELFDLLCEVLLWSYYANGKRCYYKSTLKNLFRIPMVLLRVQWTICKRILKGCKINKMI